MTLELHTERLILRPQTRDDIDGIAAGLGDFEVTRWLTVVPFPYTRRDAQEWVDRLTPVSTERAIFSIDLPGTGFIGTVTIMDELGYWLARLHWGHGYMTEAARALVGWYFAEKPASVILSGAHEDNGASLAVQRKLGFVATGTSSRHVRSQGRDITHIETRLTPEAFALAGGREA
jgi:RimJ/RimL family protein N-acetyltransferase